MSDGITDIRELLKKHNGFVLAGHTNPDGDAVGACFSLGMALEKMGKKVSVVLEKYAAKFNIIPGAHLLFKDDMNDLKAEVFICLDCADIRRVGAPRDLFVKADVTCCIDHHETNGGFAMFNYLDGGASSTSEMMFRVLDGFVEIDKDMATALYAGIIYDTGGFRFNAVGAHTLDIAGKLMNKGIKFTDIYNEILHIHTYGAARLLARVIEDSRLVCGGKIIYSCATTRMIREAGALASELDGAVEFLLNTGEVELASLLYEKPNGEVKISFRSRGINVDKIAVSLGGGGHRLASGCTVRGEIHEVAERIVGILEAELARYE